MIGNGMPMSQRRPPRNMRHLQPFTVVTTCRPGRSSRFTIRSCGMVTPRRWAAEREEALVGQSAARYRHALRDPVENDMYLPPAFKEDRFAVQHALMRAHPLAMLVTLGEGGLVANPVPLVLDPAAGERGTLRGHLARANPQWRAFDATVEALAIFQGAEHYITPSWYATKGETGKVVPTWNYAVVQAYGPLRVVEDPAWLARQIRSLTAEHEGSRSAPWAVEDAPADFVAAQIRGIVGIEIPITRIEAKWKASQNRNEADRAGVVAGLRAEEDAAASAMADLVVAGSTPRR